MPMERLSKIMASRGLCSRREADRYIERGWVRVDGKVVSELGSRVAPDAVIELAEAGRKRQAARTTFLLNKPIGYVSAQPEDGHRPAAVLLCKENRWTQDRSPRRFHPAQLSGLAPAGRLDIVPVFHGAAVLEAEDLERDAQGGEIVLVVGEGEIPVLEDPHEGDAGVGPGQPLEEGGEALAAFVGLGIVLDVLRLVDDGGRAGVPRLDALQEQLDEVALG